MNTKASAIKGLPIFDLSQNKQTEKAQDIVLNPETKKIEGIVVNKGGIGSAMKVVLISDIKSIGKDAIVVNSAEALKEEQAIPENVKTLIKEGSCVPKGEVMSETGEKLGKVSDIIFNPQSGQVEELEV